MNSYRKRLPGRCKLRGDRWWLLKYSEGSRVKEKEEADDPPKDSGASVIQPPAWLRNNPIFKKWHRRDK
jgi:hypothetical protein